MTDKEAAPANTAPRRILTVSREFGSGGRTVAKSVASRLGIPFYDRELVDKIAVETGFSPDYIEEESEYSRGKSFLSYAFSCPGVPGIMGGLSPSDYLWTVQRKIILDLADKGPCVILGRCADFILRERTDTLNVFIYADRDFRINRITSLYGDSDKTPTVRIDDMDSKRRVHYKHFTDRLWGLAKNYDISLSTSALGMEPCADLIVKLMNGEGV